MKKLLIMLCPVVMLAGCALGAWTDTLRTGWEQNLKGKPIDVAIARMGVPQGERTIAGHHVYTWVSDLYPAITPCKIDIEVDPAEIMTHMRFEGALANCDRYVQAISKQ